MKRRDFLKGLLALPAAVAMPLNVDAGEEIYRKETQENMHGGIKHTPIAEGGIIKQNGNFVRNQFSEIIQDGVKEVFESHYRDFL
jgi:hypothetical protein